MTYPYWLKLFLLILLFVLGSVVAATLLPLCRYLPYRRINTLVPLIQSVWFRTACHILGVRITTQGTPMLNGGLWVSNHISWLDIVVLAALQPVTFLAKSEIASWAVVGFLARQSGNLFIQRGRSSKELSSIMTQRLSLGDKLVLFPEGTTTRGHEVRHFHGRLLQPAISANVTVQAVALAYQADILASVAFVDDDEFLTHLLALLHLPRIDVSVYFAEPIVTSEDMLRDELSRHTRWQIATALGLCV